MNRKSKKNIVWIVSALLIAAAVFIFLVGNQRQNAYNKALSFEKSGDAQNAYMIFQKLGKYKDSAAHLSSLLTEDPILPLRSAQKGDPVTFGRYEQNNIAADGAEPIQWLVLDRIENRLLLLSAQGLDGKPYNTIPFEAVTWEECSLRSWLNEEFFRTAFSEEEQVFIPSVLNRNQGQSAVGTAGGEDTRDRVFLLSETDYSIYMNNEMNRDMIGKATATDYAAAHGVETHEESYMSWWLRSPGVYPYSAQFVNQNGELHLSGAYVDIDYQFAVRPAVWLDLQK